MFKKCALGTCETWFDGVTSKDFCSSKCLRKYNQLKKAKPKEKRHCKYCAAEFETARGNQVFCCVAHKKRFEHEQYLQKQNYPVRKCAAEGCEYLITGTLKRKYCAVHGDLK